MDDATNVLVGMSVAQKNELLFQAGTNFNDLPAWQKRGTGLYWEDYEKESIDPRNQTPCVTTRRRIKRNLELPMGDAYSQFIIELIKQSEVEVDLKST